MAPDQEIGIEKVCLHIIEGDPCPVNLEPTAFQSGSTRHQEYLSRNFTDGTFPFEIPFRGPEQRTPQVDQGEFHFTRHRLQIDAGRLSGNAQGRKNRIHLIESDDEMPGEIFQLRFLDKP